MTDEEKKQFVEEHSDEIAESAKTLRDNISNIMPQLSVEMPKASAGAAGENISRMLAALEEAERERLKKEKRSKLKSKLFMAFAFVAGVFFERLVNHFWNDIVAYVQTIVQTIFTSR